MHLNMGFIYLQAAPKSRQMARNLMVAEWDGQISFWICYGTFYPPHNCIDTPLILLANHNPIRKYCAHYELCQSGWVGGVVAEVAAHHYGVCGFEIEYTTVHPPPTCSGEGSQTWRVMFVTVHTVSYRLGAALVSEGCCTGDTDTCLGTGVESIGILTKLGRRRG